MLIWDTLVENLNVLNVHTMLGVVCHLILISALSFIMSFYSFINSLRQCIITYSVTDERNEAQRGLRIRYQPHSN